MRSVITRKYKFRILELINEINDKSFVLSIFTYETFGSISIRVNHYVKKSKPIETAFMKTI